jgi:carbonic anhydrase
MQEIDPEFFTKLSHLQSPEYLWIGCSDSRVPANQIVGLLPGEVFVHRNVANVVVHTDLNCLSVIQFAVEALKVKHIMVVGHYGCGGVKAALDRQRVGLVDIWLRHVRDVHDKHVAAVDALPVEERHDRLCELNVLEQVANVCHTFIVQDAWARGQPLTVHGWIYGLKDGLMRDLGFTVHRPEDFAPRYKAALVALGRYLTNEGTPPPSRGRLGGGWGWHERDANGLQHLPHPHPNPPLEGEGIWRAGFLHATNALKDEHTDWLITGELHERPDRYCFRRAHANGRLPGRFQQHDCAATWRCRHQGSG